MNCKKTKIIKEIKLMIKLNNSIIGKLRIMKQNNINSKKSFT